MANKTRRHRKYLSNKTNKKNTARVGRVSHNKTPRVGRVSHNKTPRVGRASHNKTPRVGRVSHIYSKSDFSSGDGMLTTVWGPSMWHFLHTMSFNYPVKPTAEDKKHYSDFIYNLQYILPCGHCRKNLKNNFKSFPLKPCHLENRNNFSRYIYGLHELINKMLNKKSGLKYCDIRERYEHFRSRCTEEKPKLWDFEKEKAERDKKFNQNKSKKEKEKGCTEPLYGEKSKCIIKIVPQTEKCGSFEMDNRCVKQRGL